MNPYNSKLNPKEWEAWEQGYREALTVEVENTRAQWSCGHVGWLACVECFDWERRRKPWLLSPLNLKPKGKRK